MIINNNVSLIESERTIQLVIAEKVFMYHSILGLKLYKNMNNGGVGI